MKNKKIKTVYREDTGETIYSMAALNGMTPEEQETAEKQKKNSVKLRKKEKNAMIRAAFAVYTPVLLCVLVGFAAVALIMYLILR